MKANDIDFFRKYHTGKATEVREGVIEVLRKASAAITREELLAGLPEGSQTYLASDQPGVFDVTLSNLESEGWITTVTRGATVTYQWLKGVA